MGMVSHAIIRDAYDAEGVVTGVELDDDLYAQLECEMVSRKAGSIIMAPNRQIWVSGIKVHRGNKKGIQLTVE